MRVARLLREDFQFTAAPPVVWWAERNLVLPRKMSPARPGPFQTQRSPTSRAILECFHPNSGVRMLANVAGAQTAKTTEGCIGSAYRICHSPMPQLILGPSEDWLRLEISEKRLMALIDENPILARMKPGDSSRFRKMAMEMAGGTISLEGANSPVATAGSTQGIVWIEEAAKIEHHSSESTPEAHPIKLAFERTKAFRGLELHYLSFTPNTPHHLAWQLYESGTQTHFYLPCPHCGEWFPFEFEVRKEGELEEVLEASQQEAKPEEYRSLVWSPAARRADGSWDEDLIRESCVYVCPHNGCEIREEDRLPMIAQYETRAQNANASKGQVSFRRPSFYSATVTFADMAIEFLRRGDLFSSGLQNFYNSWLAKPWQQMAANVKEEHVLALRGESPRGLWPERPVLIFLTCDPGEKQTHWMLSGIMESGDLRVCDYGVVTGPEEVLNREFQQARMAYLSGTTERLEPHRGFMDSGWATERTYDICEQSKGFWWPTKGTEQAFGSWKETQAASRPRLRLYTYSDTQLKDELYQRRIQRRKTPRIILPSDAGADLVMGLSGQQKDRQSGKWKKLVADHYGDCLKLAVLGEQIARAFLQRQRKH